jgi:hypothetical protein
MRCGANRRASGNNFHDGEFNMGSPGFLAVNTPQGEENRRRLEDIMRRTREARLQARYDALGGEPVFGPIDRKEDGAWYFVSGSALLHTPQKWAVFEIKGSIYRKWTELGGIEYGYPDTDEMGTPDGVGRYNHFANHTASIYWTPETGAFEVHGDIRKRWAKLGWETGLGYPVTDELGAPDGVGRYNHFSGSASIYWTPTTGAVEVYGAIRDKWASLGWEASYVGYPTRAEDDFSEGGRASSFQNGEIYWWPDVGAIDLKGVVVTFKGFHCFGETDEPSASDEPYLVFAIVAAGVWSTLRTPITEGVDARESFPSSIEIYRGVPYGINIGTVLMEHDAGDPDRYKKNIQDILMGVHDGGVFALEFIPIAGPPIAKAADALLGPLMPHLGAALSDALGLGDDRIGSSNLSLTGRQMVVLAARTGEMDFKTLSFKVETGLISGDGASYKGYFTLSPA